MEMAKESAIKLHQLGQYPALLILASLASGSLAQADDNQGLRRGGDPKQVSISGLSSGAAMAVPSLLGRVVVKRFQTLLHRSSGDVGRRVRASLRDRH